MLKKKFNKDCFLKAGQFWFVMSLFLCFQARDTLTASEKNLPEIFVTVGLIWEGAHLRKANLDAVEAFREKFPRIPFIQYLNPAYLTRNGIGDSDLKKHAESIRSTILPHDIIGLHVHPWKSLVSKAGVPFRFGPTFWGYEPGELRCLQDCGHEVPLSAYKPYEIRMILKESLRTLKKWNFNPPEVFMAGAGMASPQVLSEVKNLGFDFDFSPLSLKQMRGELSDFPLENWISHLWSSEQQPGPVGYYYTEHGKLIQGVQNSFPSFHANVQTLRAEFDSFKRVASRRGEGRWLFHISIYQETFFEFEQSFSELMNQLSEEEKQQQSFHWLSSPEFLRENMMLKPKSIASW